MLINTELQKSCYYLYQYYNNIKQTRDENREKCKLGDSSSVVDAIPNSPNQHHKNYMADSKNNTEEILGVKGLISLTSFQTLFLA